MVGKRSGSLTSKLRELRSLPLQLPMPHDPRLNQLCQALLDAPGDQRPLEAMGRLGRGQTVTQIALDLGYEISAMFRRVSGASPRHYRNRPAAD